MASNNNEEEDPFGAFGDDDSDSGGGDSSDHAEADPQLIGRAQALRQLANQPNNNKDNKIPSASVAPIMNEEQGQTSTASVDLSHLEPYSSPSWEAPKYLSPNVRLVSNLPVGGGRGFVAVRDLKPGSLVLVEDLLMEWPEAQLGKALSLSSVQLLLQHANAQRIVHCLEDFHPTKEDVDSHSESDAPEQVEEMMASLRVKHVQEDDARSLLLNQLVVDAKQRGIQNKNASDLSSEDILRIFLALQYNGLESGLYCYIAMLNHQCQPNCVKFLPGSSLSSSNDEPIIESSRMPSTHSEVRTTRRIPAGESLTISYMPKIKCHASRRHHLWQQHRFDIGVKYLETNGTGTASGLRQMELIMGGIPRSSKEYVDENSLTTRMERSLEEMDLLYQSTKESLSSKSSLKTEGSLLEQAKALEISSLELYTHSRQELGNDKHLLLIPCLVLHLDSCDLVLRCDAKRSFISHTQRCKLLGRTVVTALKLLDLQKAYWGEDGHFDVARTCLDLSQAIGELLAKSPKHLSELDTNGRMDLKGFHDWSSLELKCRKEHERIKELYPQDAMDHVVRKQQQQQSGSCK